MLLSIDLQDAINQAQDALLKDSLNNLAAFYRQAIYKAIGSFEQPSSLEVHTRLSLRAARFVSFKWFEAWPKDNLPNQILDVAESKIGKKINKEEASKKCLDAWDRLCVHLEETKCETAFSAGLT